MQIRFSQLDAQLKNGPVPAHLVSGDEPLQLVEACDAIRARYRESGCEERKVYDVERGFDWQAFADEVANIGLFSSRRLVEVRFAAAPDKSAGERILHCITHCIQDNFFLFRCGRLDARAMKSAWVQGIDRVGIVLRVWPLEGRQLESWLRGRLQKFSLSADRETLQMLCHRVEGNLLAAAQEIEKLRLFAENGAINTHTVSMAVADNARYDVFQLVEYALTGDAAACVRSLQRLREEGTPPLQILAVLSREIRKLGRAAVQIERGVSDLEALRNEGVWQRRIPLMRQALQRHRRPGLEALLQYAARVDRAVKGDKNLSAWGELSRLSLRLAGIYALRTAG